MKHLQIRFFTLARCVLSFPPTTIPPSSHPSPWLELAHALAFVVSALNLRTSVQPCPLHHPHSPPRLLAKHVQTLFRVHDVAESKRLAIAR